MSAAKDFERCLAMSCLGCRGSKRMRQALCMQWMMLIGVVYLWTWYNGGLLPVFLSPVLKNKFSTSDIMNHFGNTVFGDGLRVTWAHAANSRKSVYQAIQGDAMMIEGDVLLRGQNTANQYLVPVMAHPPQTDSDITLKEWLQIVMKSGKGVKLDFKSIESVKIGLQFLNEANIQPNVPVHLSAEVVEGPNSFMAPNKFLDPSRFIKQCQKVSPSSTLALGWTNGWSEDGEKFYTWSMVKKMYDIVEEYDIQQPLSFNVRAKLTRNSLTQLKWLMEMTGGSLTLFSPLEDNLIANDILNVRHRLPMDKIFYDIPESVKNELKNVPKDNGVDERKKFILSQWKAVRSKGGENIYLGSEAVILRSGLLLSKEEYKPNVDKDSVTIKGHVQFTDIPTVPEEGDSSTTPVGVGVFLRVSQSSIASIHSGIRCFVGFDGHIEISTQSIPGVDRKEEGFVTGTIPCFNFVIRDYPDLDKIVMTVSRVKTCSDSVPQIDEDNAAKVEFSMKDISIESHFMALRAPSTQAFVVVDQFEVE